MGSAALPGSGHCIAAVGASDILCFGGLADGAAATPPQQGARPRTAAPAAQRTLPPRPMTAGGGVRPSSALYSFDASTAEWKPLAAEGGVQPPARSGHACVALDAKSLLVLGGASAAHKKLGDAWVLERTKTEAKTSEWLELTLDAWTAERAEREAAAAKAAAAAAADVDAAAAAAAAAAEAASKGGKGGKGAPPPAAGAAAGEAVVQKPVLSFASVAKALGSALGGLPAACFRIRGDEGGGDEGGGDEGGEEVRGLTVRVEVLPLVGVGLHALGADGEALPPKAMCALEALMSKLYPMPSAEEEAALAAGAKGGKGGKPAGGEDEAAARAKAQRALAQKRLLGYECLNWKVHRERSVATVAAVLWHQPAIDGTWPTARSGHTATRLRECVVVFGGAGERGPLNDVHVLSAPSLLGMDGTPDGGGGHVAKGGMEGGDPHHFAWASPEVSGTPPAPRAYHTAVGRVGYADAAAAEQLLVYGGTGNAGRLGEVHVLALPSFAWSIPRVDGSIPAPRCWHTATALSPPGMGATAFGMLVYGGVDGRGRPLRDCYLLKALTEIAAGDDPNAKDAKGGKGKAPDKGKGAKGPPEEEEEEDSRPYEFGWVAMQVRTHIGISPHISSYLLPPPGTPCHPLPPPATTCHPLPPPSHPLLASWCRAGLPT